MINIAEVSSYITRTTPRGHKYAISIATDSSPLDIRTPSYGGNHTSVFGKLAARRDDRLCPVRSVDRLADDHHGSFANGSKIYEGPQTPDIQLSGREMNIDVP